MRKTFFAISFLLSLSISYSKIQISGEVKNATANSKVILSYYNNNVEWIEVYADSTKLDNDGRFKLNFDFDKPKNARLFIDSQYVSLFLVDGDSLNLNVDYPKFDETINFNGKGSSDNNYLVAEAQIDFYSEARKSSSFTDSKQYTHFVDSIENENIKLFKEFKSNGYEPLYTPEFLKYINAANKYKYINVKESYTIKYDRIKNGFVNRELPEDYLDFLKDINLNDQEIYENSYYSVAVNNYFSHFYDRLKLENDSDTLSNIQKNELRILRDYNNRKSLLKGKALDFQITDFVKMKIVYKYTSDKFLELLFEDYKKTCKNKEYISIIEKIYSKSQKLLKGKPAPEFSFLDSNGKQISLSSFKGKVVYLDFWATWCGPCIIEMKNSKALEEKLKDQKDLVFLKINVRDNKDSWLKYISKEKLGGINIHATLEESAKVMQEYNFDGIPKYVLLDKQGNIININAYGPGSDEKSILDALKN